MRFALRAWRLPVVLVTLLVAAGCIGVGRPAKPDYQAAVTELRQARWLLDEPGGSAPMSSQDQAAVQIDTAVALIAQRLPSRAVTMPAGTADPVSNRIERVHYALQHLDSARLLLTREEYDANRHAVRNEAISCIARAQDALGRTLEALLR